MPGDADHRCRPTLGDARRSASATTCAFRSCTGGSSSAGARGRLRAVGVHLPDRRAPLGDPAAGARHREPGVRRGAEPDRPRRRAALPDFGHSLIVDPWGTPIARASNQETRRARRDRPRLSGARAPGAPVPRRIGQLTRDSGATALGFVSVAAVGVVGARWRGALRTRSLRGADGDRCRLTSCRWRASGTASRDGRRYSAGDSSSTAALCASIASGIVDVGPVDQLQRLFEAFRSSDRRASSRSSAEQVKFSLLAARSNRRSNAPGSISSTQVGHATERKHEHRRCK